jgi:RNA polymerase sigma-70 factor (ECF subfamily)
MPGREHRIAESAAFIYCLLPRELADALHELLVRHFDADPRVRVVVERRDGERRDAGERRASSNDSSPEAGERRRVRAASGRRVAERRAAAVQVDCRMLPRRARRFADQLVFIERIEPSAQAAEDVDTARLVMRIQGGEGELFSSLYERYFGRVYGYLRLLLRDPHEAEDVTQQVFTSVLRALPRYERRRQPFRAWLFVIARNEALRSLRRANLAEPVDPHDLGERVEGLGATELPALDWISDHDLTIFLRRLPIAQRQVLALRYMLDLPTSEIAAILDRSPDDVRMLEHRALRVLRARLSAVGRQAREHRPARMRRRVPEAVVMRARRFAIF